MSDSREAAIRAAQEMLIQMETALFEGTELMVTAMKERGMTRQEARERLGHLQEGQDPRVIEAAMAQFDMIWPERP